MSDPVMEQMADELRHVLVTRGIDPRDPPSDSAPPAEAMWAEYQRRGGQVYSDPDVLAGALVRRVAGADR